MRRSIARGLQRVALTLGIAGNVTLPAMDLLPDSSCRNPTNLRLLRQCNPYQVQLIYVDPSHLMPRQESGRHFSRRFSTRPHPSPVRHQQIFEHLIQRYIDYEEQLQLRRLLPHHRRQVPSVHTPLIPSHVKPASPGRQKPSVRKPHNITQPKKTPLPPHKKTKEKEEENLTRIPRKKSVKQAVAKEREQNLTVTASPAVFPAAKISEIKAIPESAPSLKTPAQPTTLVHRVEAGESLIGLARRYGTTPYDLRHWNHLKRGHLLKIGEKLTIHPGRKSTPEEIREGLLRERYGRYRVKKGDTLLGVAKRFKVKAAAIQQLNRLKKRQALQIGQKLILPLSPKKINAVLEREKGYHFKYTGDYRFKHKLRVAATAYTSHRSQTDRTPFLAAWNNRIRPGMKIIAVSPDLIRKYGITNGTRVKISGLRGIYVVRDKMNPRLHNHIDIYMGLNRRKALRWGRRSVILYW